MQKFGLNKVRQCRTNTPNTHANQNQKKKNQQHNRISPVSFKTSWCCKLFFAELLLPFSVICAFPLIPSSPPPEPNSHAIQSIHINKLMCALCTFVRHTCIIKVIAVLVVGSGMYLQSTDIHLKLSIAVLILQHTMGLRAPSWDSVTVTLKMKYK